MPNIKHRSYAMPTKTRGRGTAPPCCRLAVTLVLGHLRQHQPDAQAPSATTRLRLTPSRAPRSSRPTRLLEHHLFDEMPRYPDPTAEASAGSGRTVVAPALAPGTEYGIDDLPRDLLLRVLSCLDARQVVQTCVLSQLWRDLWRDVRRINASRREFEIKNDGDYDARNPLFKKLVNRFLMLRNPVPLEEFRLWYCSRSQIKGDHEEANLWIGNALLFNARSVEVYVWGDKLDIDPAVFTSEHLRSLLFDGVILTPGFFRQLQSECRALERLILQDCPITDVEISSQTLKFLSIGQECLFQSDDQASICTPNLIHFGFFAHAPHPRIPLLKNMESLVTAYITLDGFQFNDTLVDDIRQFLLGLSCARKMDLYFGQTKLAILGNNLQWCPKFNNLKLLTLGTWCLDANFYGLIVFLQNSPNLEKLTLELKEYVGAPKALMGEQGNRSFACEHLMTVEIICSEHGPMIDRLKELLLGSGMTPCQIHIRH
ncbi:putative F-box/FBD/LRR-repeat protein At1g78760 isoform X1 [Setaria italica]|nr:putative F-box/FBD/LRR-repeat protein At1g78760 isoform X1 [Setaria italica]